MMYYLGVINYTIRAETFKYYIKILKTFLNNIKYQLYVKLYSKINIGLKFDP